MTFPDPGLSPATDPARREPLRVALIAGDGIGPELVDSAARVLAAASQSVGEDVCFTEEPGGASTYEETGVAMPAEVLQRLRTCYDAVLKGPVGLPHVRHADGTEAGLLGGIMRTGMDAFANVRPMRLRPGVHTPVRHAPNDIDYVIVRENTEGLYLSRGLGVVTRDAVSDQLMLTRRGCARICRYAFELARQRHGAPGDGVRRVTCVDKSNVLRSYALFREVFDDVAEAYPDIDTDHRYADAAGHDLVANPSHFDVIVTENFLGDLLSDVGAATVGGLGMCPSGNIGDGVSYFEPIHGSAPGLAGQDRANPLSQILSAAMLLHHCGRDRGAQVIERAVTDALASGEMSLTPHQTPVGGTEQVTRTVLDRINQTGGNAA